MNSPSSVDDMPVESGSCGQHDLRLAIQEMESALNRLDRDGHLICAAELSRAIESAKALLRSE